MLHFALSNIDLETSTRKGEGFESTSKFIELWKFADKTSATHYNTSATHMHTVQLIRRTTANPSPQISRNNTDGFTKKNFQ